MSETARYGIAMSIDTTSLRQVTRPTRLVQEHRLYTCNDSPSILRRSAATILDASVIGFLGGIGVVLQWAVYYGPLMAGADHSSYLYTFSSQAFLVTLSYQFLVFLITAFAPLIGPTIWLVGSGSYDQQACFLAATYMILFNALYCSVLESSPWQATFGKRLFFITVQDCQGCRLSFGKALARHFIKAISLYPLGAGFLTAAFSKRRCWHDVSAEAFVLDGFFGTAKSARSAEKRAHNLALPIAAIAIVLALHLVCETRIVAGYIAPLHLQLSEAFFAYLRANGLAKLVLI